MPKNKNVGNIPMVDQNGREITGNQNKANVFNEYFVNIGVTMAEKIEQNYLQDNEIYKTTQKSSIYLSTVSKNDITLSISKLKNNCSPGPDGITSKLIKALHSQLTSPLLHLIKLVFTKGKLPRQWKESIITPVYKSGKQNQLTNYRPISIINNFAKVFEYCLREKLLNYFDMNGVLTENQFGFRKNLSTENAVLKLSEQIIQNLDNSRKCLAVFLDLAKAFDTVSHRILIDKLYDSGIRGPALEVIRNYIQNRTQRVKIQNTLSDSAVVTVGVPQGTVLGPLLFLIYLNDMSQIKNFHGRIISYADDTAVVFDHSCWPELYQLAEHNISKLYKWLNRNLLSLNFSKTKYVAFSLDQRDQPSGETLNIQKNDCQGHGDCTCPKIEKTNSIKYLGVIVDQHIRWDEHINYVINRTRKLIHKFYTLRDILSRKVIMLVYNSLIESVFRYCITAWGGVFNNIIHKLQTTQNTILKIILKKTRLHSTEQLYQESQTLNIRNIYILQSQIWIFNKKNRILSQSRYTRHTTEHTLYIPRFNKTHMQRSIFYFGPKIFNSLPTDLKKCDNLRVFKKTMKTHIRQNQLESRFF